jgi:DNA repair protein RecO (recombination protein O)
MAQEQKLQGYIIKTQDLNEADLLLTFFSYQSGKTRFLAKSAKKMMSKLRGRLQPNCLIEVTLTSQGSLPLVISSEVITSYQEIIKHQDQIQAVIAAQEIILKALPDELPNEVLYQNFTQVLKSLNTNKSGSSLLVLLKFLNSSLQALGFAPELLTSSAELPAQVFYNLGEGKFKSEYLTASDQLISKEAYQCLVGLTKAEEQTFTNAETGKELLKVLSAFLTYQLERDLKALEYFAHQLA